MIKIDMEMPVSCEKCQLRIKRELRMTYYCAAKDKISLNAVAKKDRHESCPLIEIEKLSKVFGALSPLLEGKK